MEFDSSFHGATATALALVMVGLLWLRLITPLERRLLVGAALLLAGLFLLSRPELEATVIVGGAGAWMRDHRTPGCWASCGTSCWRAVRNHRSTFPLPAAWYGRAWTSEMPSWAHTSAKWWVR